jgi:hypothetical protein
VRNRQEVIGFSNTEVTGVLDNSKILNRELKTETKKKNWRLYTFLTHWRKEQYRGVKSG